MHHISNTECFQVPSCTTPSQPFALSCSTSPPEWALAERARAEKHSRCLAPGWGVAGLSLNSCLMLLHDYGAGPRGGWTVRFYAVPRGVTNVGCLYVGVPRWREGEDGGKCETLHWCIPMSIHSDCISWQYRDLCKLAGFTLHRCYSFTGRCLTSAPMSQPRSTSCPRQTRLHLFNYNHAERLLTSPQCWNNMVMTLARAGRRLLPNVFSHKLRTGTTYWQSKLPTAMTKHEKFGF